MLSLKIYSEKIFYYENVMDDPQEIIHFLEKEDEGYQKNNGIGRWEDWKTSSDEPYQFGEKKVINFETIKNSEEKTKNIYIKINSSIDKVLLDYKSKTKNEIGSPQSYGVARYFPEKEMGEHVDFDTNSVDSGKRSLVPTISSVLYLNNEYIGGEIEFPRQEVFVKPSAGSMIVFPSVDPFYHKSHKIVSGHKYVVPIFCYKNLAETF